VSRAQVKAPASLPFLLFSRLPSLRSAPDHLKHGRYICLSPWGGRGPWIIALDHFVVRFDPPQVVGLVCLARGCRWLPLRPLAHERGQRLHHRPMQVRCWLRRRIGALRAGGQSLVGETLKRVDAAQPHLHYVTTELLNGFAESVGDMAATGDLGLKVAC